ncbi:MAG: hypothetical protein JSR98_02995 [Proteobacteria bacterium]|nr:hypothetical protein [Pseudomonadota bacterium]
MIRLLAAASVAGLCLAPPIAQACTLIPFPPNVQRQKEREAFRHADVVATIEVVSEDYEVSPRYANAFFGNATGKILDAKKGPIKRGDLIHFEVTKGFDGIDCPAGWDTLTDHRYRLLLKVAPNGTPKIIWQREVALQSDLKPSGPR